MRKIKKVPVILQMEAVECGAASLTMILAYYKKYIPLEKMRIECNVTRDGSSAKYIVKAAMHNGLEAKAYKMDPELFWLLCDADPHRAAWAIVFDGIFCQVEEQPVDQRVAAGHDAVAIRRQRDAALIC